MENEKLQINLAPGSERAEIIIREVPSVNEIPVKPPLKIDLTGTIGAPAEFLRKRIDENDQVNQKRCHVLVDREALVVTLVLWENDFYHSGKVKGYLEEHPMYKAFGINSGKAWTPSELGMFCKMNRAFFPDKSENMKLVTDLMNFTGTVCSKIEKSVKESGDRTDNWAQVVNSNLPPAFKLKIPVFKGMAAESLEVETFAQINGREVAFILISPAANQLAEEIRDTVIDKELTDIRNIAPDIAIIEV